MNPNASPPRFVAAAPVRIALHAARAAAHARLRCDAARGRCERGRAAALPAALAPPAPFPLVTRGERRARAGRAGRRRAATYRLLTSAGPLVVSVVLADPRTPSVRLGTVLARDRIVSHDETVSSMARRTGAVAGINGDYFDIDASGAPVGVLVRDGALARSPSARAALTVDPRPRGALRELPLRRHAPAAGWSACRSPASTSGRPRAARRCSRRPSAARRRRRPASSSSGSSRSPALGPATGARRAGRSGLGPGATRYRVAAVTSGPPFAAENALRLAYGPAAQGFGPLPDVGDVVTLAADTDPPLAEVAAAIGGGPLLLPDGAPVDDPGLAQLRRARAGASRPRPRRALPTERWRWWSSTAAIRRPRSGSTGPS